MDSPSSHPSPAGTGPLRRGLPRWFRNERPVGAGSVPCACGSWHRHWMLFNPQGPSAALFQRECAVRGCHGPFEVGGHIQRIGIRDPADDGVCVIPMCRRCQGSSDLTFQLKPGVRPAPADPGQTCERRR